jgi:hypothetical protein
MGVDVDLIRQLHDICARILESHGSEPANRDCEIGPDPVTNLEAARASSFGAKFTAGYRQRFAKRNAGAMPPQTPAVARSLATTAQWVAETAEARGEAPGALATRLLDRFFASTKAAEARYRAAFLAADPLEWLGEAPAAVRPRQNTMSELTPGQRAEANGAGEPEYCGPPPEFLQALGKIGRAV